MTELPPPREDERSMAMLVNILSIFTGMWGPLIILIIKRESKFVAFHSLQCLFWHLLYTIVFFLLFIVFFMGVFLQLLTLHPHASGPPAAIALFPLMFLVFLGFWVLNITLGIVFGMKAKAGEWAGYPLVGGLARRLIIT